MIWNISGSWAPGPNEWNLVVCPTMSSSFEKSKKNNKPHPSLFKNIKLRQQKLRLDIVWLTNYSHLHCFSLSTVLFSFTFCESADLSVQHFNSSGKGPCSALMFPDFHPLKLDFRCSSTCSVSPFSLHIPNWFFSPLFTKNERTPELLKRWPVDYWLIWIPQRVEKKREKGEWLWGLELECETPGEMGNAESCWKCTAWTYSNENNVFCFGLCWAKHPTELHSGYFAGAFEYAGEEHSFSLRYGTFWHYIFFYVGFAPTKIEQTRNTIKRIWFM